MSGQVFGRYRLVRLLGTGGMAEVYEAVAERPGGFSQRCVVKRVLPQLAQDPTLVKMFVTEARVNAQLQHPNIVQIIDFGEVEGEPFLAMEYIEGVDVLDILRRSQQKKVAIPLALCCYLVSEVAAALDYAHRRTDGEGRPLEIVHRDVTPSNIMVTNAGTVKLLDFGIAKVASHARDERTRTGSFKGKIGYMSPEQAEGEEIDARSDIFSLGILFHESLTLQRVFRGRDDFQTLRLIRDAAAPPPSVLRPDVPPEIDQLVMRMLKRQPVERFSSCEELLEALSPIVHSLHADARMARAFVASVAPGGDDTMMLPVNTPSPTTRPPSGAVPVKVESTFNLTSGQLESLPTGRYLLRGRSRWAGIALGLAAVGGVAAFATSATCSHQRTALVLDPVAASSLPSAAEALPAPTLAPAPAPPAPTPAAAPEPEVAEAPAPAPVALPSPPEVAPRPLPVERPKVALQIVGTDGAEVFDEDDRLMGTMPLTLELDKRKSPRELTVRKSGYVETTREVAGNTSARLEIRLARKHKSAAKAGQIKDPYDQ